MGLLNSFLTLNLDQLRLQRPSELGAMKERMLKLLLG